jgi:signal transduction histidine kinase/ActR/RegA family two-component response regulator
MQAIRRWFNQIALEDPTQWRQAYVLQFVILGIIVILLIANFFILVMGSQVPSLVQQFVLLTNAAATILMGVPWFLLRRGRYRMAVFTLVGLIFLGIAAYLFIEGVSQSYLLLLFVIPITLSGLLLGRLALWLTIGITVLLLSIVAFTITPPIRPYNPTSLVVTFILLIVLQGLLLDQLVAGLWEALAEALKKSKILAERDQERQKLLAAAEQHIREREQIEAVLHQTQKLESLGVMAGGIAHDFNNLLSAMLGQSSVAKMKLPAESPAIQHIDRSIAAAERAADLTRQLLIYSGRGQIERKPINLNEVIQENLPLLKVTIPANVQLKHTLTPELPAILADQGQMQQVVMNLVLNGAQAIGSKPGQVSINTRLYHLTTEMEPLPWQYGGHVPEPGDYVLLEVTDSGEGMLPETLDRIFEPFFTTKTTGHGLGLATVLGIVRTHQGNIQVESQPGKGTIFRLFFPIIEQPKNRPENQRIESPPLTTSPHTGLILIIDDEESVVASLTDILIMGGFTVLTAANGATGLQKYKERHQEIDLVILDISMPGMDGIETLRHLQTINSHVRIIVSSGLNRTGKLLPLTMGTMVSYLNKPYNAEKALAEVTRRLAKPIQ